MSDSSENFPRVEPVLNLNNEGGGSRKRKVTKRKNARNGKSIGGNNLSGFTKILRGGCGSSSKQDGGKKKKRGSRGGMFEELKDTLTEKVTQAIKNSSQSGGNGALVENITDAVKQAVDNASKQASQKGGNCFTATAGGKKSKTKKPSAYNLFMKKRMAEMKKTHPKLSAPEKLKKIGSEWKKRSK